MKNKNTENSTPLALTVTLRDVVESLESLREISSSKTSVALAFTIGIVLRTVNPFMQEYSKQRDILLNAHYEKPAEGQPPKFKSDDDKKEFQKELDVLLDTDVTLNGIGRIRVSTLESEGIKLDGQDVAALYWLLKNDTTPLFEQE